jgi:cytochrome c553
MKPIAALLSSVMLTAVLLAPAAAAEPKAAATQPDLDKGKARAAAVCAACHSDQANARGAAENPLLQGQHYEYLVKQLSDFKAKKRQSSVMATFVAELSEADMRNVAAYYASRKPVAGEASKKHIALGEKIYRGGIPERKVPACTGCHGPTGAGIPSQYPRLGGQHATYTEKQLLAFRVGSRNNNAQMTGVVANLRDAEIKAVAEYVAGLR